MSVKDKASEAKKGDEDRSPQVGALLRASRLRLDEDLREISDVLCIRYLYLEAIEECRYGDLPGDTYAVGFIRSYAEHMGLDGEEVVRRFRAEQTGNRRANDLSFPTPVPDSGVPKGAIVFVGVVLALLVYGGWYATTTDEGILSDLISPVPDHLKHLVTGDDAGTNSASDETASGAEQMASAAVEGAGSTDTTVPKPAPPAEDASADVSDEAPPEMGADATEPTSSETPSMDANEETISSQAGEAAERVNEAVTESATAAAEAAAPAAEEVRETVQETASATREAVESAAREVNEAVTETTSDNGQQMAVTGDTAPEPTETAETPAADEPQTETETGADTGTETPAGETTSAVTEAEPDSETPPAAQAEDRSADALNQESLERASGAEPAEAAPAAPEPPVETASATPSDSASGIVIRATDSSWVEIRDGEGNVVFTGLMSAGSTYDVPDADGLVMDTGNAGALDITVAGASVPTLGDVGAVRKGVALDAERLKAGTATNR